MVLKNLEWEEFHCTEKMSYFDALEYVETVSDYGWRIPTCQELINACKTNINGFQRWGYWSSDVMPNNYVKAVYFYTGNDWKLEMDSLMYVRFIKEI